MSEHHKNEETKGGLPEELLGWLAGEVALGSSAPQQATRYNDGKPQVSEILKFGSALDDVAKVMELGSVKYEVDNWLKGGKPPKEYLDSTMRHMMAYIAGEMYDPDLGTKHLANAAWNLLAALRLCEELKGSALDPEFDIDGFVQRYS